MIPSAIPSGPWGKVHIADEGEIVDAVFDMLKGDSDCPEDDDFYNSTVEESRIDDTWFRVTVAGRHYYVNDEVEGDVINGDWHAIHNFVAYGEEAVQ